VSDETREVTTDDFVAPANLFLRDKMLGTPMYFMTLKPSESLHITANLGITTGALSQVCVSSYALHVDPELAQRNKDTYVAKAGEDKKAQMLAALEFDNLHVQRSYSVDPVTDRPNWFDIAVESIGVIPARDLVSMAAQIYKTKIEEWTKSPIQREEGSWYRMEIEGETHTLGALVQEIMYRSGLIEYASYNIGHPLKPLLTIRFQVNTIQPEDVIERVKLEALALCDNVLK
jgi:DNA-directed RNA polymerase subunit L